jgi:DNA-binding transcriptional LysR family regulator
MAAASAALARAAAGEASADQGVVRVTASQIVGCEVLPAIFATFHANNPGIAIELALTNRNEDLSRRDADIAVRMVRPTQSALVARRIGETHIGLYAHRGYLVRFGTPTSLDELGRHRLIGFDRDDRGFRSVGALASLLSRESFGFRCDSDLAQLAALRAGVGIGGCQENIALRSPELTRVLPREIAFTLEIWLVMHDDIKATPRVRALFEHLAAGLTDFVKRR